MVKTSRQRYIAFCVSPPCAADRRTLIGIFQRAERAQNSQPLSLWLITYENGIGIVRCPHLQMAGAVKYLGGIGSAVGAPFTVKTLSASGTLRALRARHDLKKPKQDRDGHGTRRAGTRPWTQNQANAGRRSMNCGAARSGNPRITGRRK